MIYSQVIITQKGQNLIAKLHASGESTQIVSIGTGNGTRTLTETSTQLSNQIQETTVDGVSIDPNNPAKVVVEAAPNNVGLATAYDIREIGLYATDPDEGKILYAVINTVGQEFDHMPAYESELDFKEVIYRISLTVDNAENVTFVVSPEELRQQVDILTVKVEDARKELAAEIWNILALQMWASLHQQAEIEDMSDNTVVEVFDTAAGYIVARGYYDSANHQVVA